MHPRSTYRALTLLVAGVLGAACGATSNNDTCSGPGTICTYAGTGEAGFGGDGLPPVETTLYWPMDVEFSPTGEAFIVDWQNHRVRRVTGGLVQTIIGTEFVGDGPPDQKDLTAEGAPGTTVELNHPTDVVFLPDGTMILAAWHNHKIRRWDPHTGRVHVICGSLPGGSGDEGPATRARLAQPKSIALGPDGALYVTDSKNQRIRRLDSCGLDARISTVAGAGMPGDVGDGGTPIMARFHMQQVNENPEPGGNLALDSQSHIYLADTYNHRVRRIDLTAGTVTTVAGTGTAGFGGDGGPAISAILNSPRDIEIGPDGRLYIADTDNQRIRAVDLATGIIDTVAGGGEKGWGGDGGSALAARLDRPFGIGFDPAGDLYIADTRNNRIRKVAHR